ncbi:MAG TPA: hypothetical protein VK652_06365 [Steroidobacteraceae bacterium]|nr:hypothetical protein [Steroidobacteraceae bacterium]
MPPSPISTASATVSPMSSIAAMTVPMVMTSVMSPVTAEISTTTERIGAWIRC